MKCYIPYYSGFCSGVSRAVKAAYDFAGKETYMYGEIIHNPVIMNELQEKGMHVIDSVDEIPDSPNINVLIRAHGITEQTMKELEQKNINIIDNTCTNVKRVHKIVKNASNRGLDVIIVGNSKHPEVMGTIGWCNGRVLVLNDIQETQKLIPHSNIGANGVCMVAQTTYNAEKYKEIYEYCSQYIDNIEYYVTICEATTNRQDEIRNCAQRTDAFIVIGGKNSSNVNKLYEIAATYCSNVQYIEKPEDVNVSRLKNVESLVVSSGASTPDICIFEVINRINMYCEENCIGLEIIKKQFEEKGE